MKASHRIATAGVFSLALVTLLSGFQTGDAKKPEDPKPAQVQRAELGKPAPDFSLTDLDGKTHKLSDHKGKIVVLEWFNPECPVVKDAHDKGELKTLAADMAKDGIVWIAINSGAPGMQGHGAEKNAEACKRWSLKHPVLVDEKGTVGMAYAAKTTPHMYVIDEKGVLVYRGAIDNQKSAKEGEERINYVRAAISDLKAGKPVKTAETQAYGCSVKYAKQPS
jgi:peroxiredoxin